MNQTSHLPRPFATLSSLTLLTAFALCLATQVHAGKPIRLTPEIDRHLNNAAAQLGVNPWLTKSIALTESSLNPNARNVNPDGSVDMCFMQVNSSHFSSKVMGKLLREKGYTLDNIYEPANCAMVGTFILRKNIDQFGYNWMAIGAYNAWCGGKHNTPECHTKRNKYAHMVWNSYLKLVRQEQQRRQQKGIAQWPHIHSAG